ncbi:MAG: hypothetical protein WDN44_00650 [Sphingomonas sp.]
MRGILIAGLAATLAAGAPARAQDVVEIAPGAAYTHKPSGLTVEAQPDAAPVADCAAPLAFNGKAKPAKSSGADALMNSLMSVAVEGAASKESAKQPEGPPAVWCRDPGGIAGMETSGVYRADGSADSYLIALSDAGRGISAGPNIAPVLDPKAKPSWTVSYIEMDKTIFFAPQDRLPPPDQAVAIVKEGHYTSSATTWGKSDITINGDTLK